MFLHETQVLRAPGTTRSFEALIMKQGIEEITNNYVSEYASRPKIGSEREEMFGRTTRIYFV